MARAGGASTLSPQRSDRRTALTNSWQSVSDSGGHSLVHWSPGCEGSRFSDNRRQGSFLAEKEAIGCALDNSIWIPSRPLVTCGVAARDRPATDMMEPPTLAGRRLLGPWSVFPSGSSYKDFPAKSSQ